jgi:CheY-like chemotaxis protein
MKKTVLLVEDDPHDIFFMKRAMDMAGLSEQLRIVEDGQAAVDYLSGQGEWSDPERYPLPSLVLLDLKLPQMGGLEVLAWIRQRRELAGIMVVVLTSSQLPEDIESAYRLGANSYLAKPTNGTELPRVIGRIKEYWLELNTFVP